jgi:hypothetical protein
MSDLDVLIPYEQRETALEVINALGYHFHESEGELISSQEALELNLTHHYHLRGGINDAVALELHFRLLSTDDILLPLDKLGWFWTQTTAIQNKGTYAIPLPEAHLLYLCAHAILQHGESEAILRQYFDLHQLITNTSINWDIVVAQSTALGWGYAVERGLSIANQYFSTPVPTTVFSELQKNHTKHDPATKRAVRTQGKGTRWVHLSVKLHQLSFFEQIKLVRRVLFPSQSYMRIRYGLPSDQRIWSSYLYRWLDQVEEVAWALWSRLITARDSKE